LILPQFFVIVLMIAANIRYFSVSSHVAVSSWSTNDKAALEPCGHCDNCTRPPEEVEHRDVTVEAWQLLKVANAVCIPGGNIPLTKLVDLARGRGGGSFTTSTGGGKRAKTKSVIALDLDAVASGKVCLGKDVRLILMVPSFCIDDKVSSRKRKHSWCNSYFWTI
jgi:hypothetical protein